VTALEGKDLVAAMREAGRSDGTIRNAIVPLREMLGHAAEDKLIPSNPLAGIRLFGNKRRAPRKVQPPTRDQVDAIVANAKREDAREAIRFAAATGLRRGELFALTWGDVDFDARTIHVHASNYAGKISDGTKTDAGDRHVPLFKSIRQLLLERKARSRFSQPEDFVFPTVVGTPMDPGNFVKREFRPAIRAAGLERCRWHDLRHYAVSALIAEGADIKLLQAIAGHATAAMTLDVYGHLMLDRVTEAADRYDPMGADAAATAVAR
jgi:integrase